MPTGTAKTVLVVGDHAAVRRGVCDALKFSGYRVLDASDGKTGLALDNTSQVDLILLDILMPHMTGLEVLASLRQARRAVPVIFLTAKGLEEDRIKGLRLGADDYVVKPFSAAELLARVEAVLRRSSERPKPLTTITLHGKTIDFERRQVLREDGTPDWVVIEIKRQARLLAGALDVRGLMNIQFAVTGLSPAVGTPEVYILEANPRASRTVPFVSKATGVQLARLAARVMAGGTLDELGVTDEVVPTHYSIKESVLPFSQFPGVDVILGPEMRSTGEP